MNKVQRLLLLLFAVIISSSSSFDTEYLKFFLIAVLVFFALCPATWWKRIRPIYNTVRASQDVKQEESSNENSDFEVGVDPAIGGNKRLLQISQESVAYFMNLYRLRIGEILRSYSEICMTYPDSEEVDSWALKLLKDCAKYEGPSWDSKSEEEEQKAEKEAILAYDKRFCHLFGWCASRDDVEVVDMQIFLSVYSGSCRGILKRLKYFKEINFASIKVQKLIDHYSVILDCVGNEYQFTNFLKFYERGSDEERARDKARASFMHITSLWNEIKDLMISNLLVSMDAKIGVSHCFKELDMFDTLYRCFRNRLRSENERELQRSLMMSVSKEQDAIFKEYYSQQPYYRIFE